MNSPGSADGVHPRIVICANNVDEVGGVQRVVHALARGLATRGFPVTLVGIVPHEDRYPYNVDGPYDVQRLMPGRMPPPVDASPARRKADPKIRRAIREWEAAATVAAGKLQQVLDAGPPGIVIATQLGTMELLARCDLGDRCAPDRWRVIAQYHLSFEAAVRTGDLARAQAACTQADAFVLLTAEDAKECAEHGFNNATWMENPLQTWPDTTADPQARVVTFLGRYTAVKGPQVLLSAWRRLHQESPDLVRGWQVRMYGSGRDEDLIRDLAADLPDVQVHPATVDSLGVLAAGSVMAMPSLEEGLPMVLAEAMSVGLACVATDCSVGVRALVQDDVTGVLVERGDVSSLAEGLAKVMASSSLRSRLGTAARERVASMQVDRILDRWQALLADVQR